MKIPTSNSKQKPNNRLVSIALIALFSATACSGPQPTPQPTPPPEPPPVDQPHQRDSGTPKPPIPTPKTDTAYFAVCNGEVTNLESVLNPIADKLTKQKIMYSLKPKNEWTDCSGNFLRLSSYLASDCPEQARHLIAPPGVKAYVPGGDNVGPGNVQQRSSRAVAAWYHAKNRFTPIYYDDVATVTGIPNDLGRHRHLIRPGAVLWFSRDRPSSVRGLQALFDENGDRTRINHMGTVTSVTRDEQGQVIQYAMYHGHGTTKKPKLASVTKKQFWSHDGKQYPSFGYWKQYLVGVGSIVPTTN